MNLLFKNVSVDLGIYVNSSQTKHSTKSPKNPKWLWVIVCAIILASAVTAVVLHPIWGIPEDRGKKLDSILKKLDEKAEQYALVATMSGFYPCPSCSGKDSIFLNFNEVWKYGVSVNGQKGRYKDSYLTENNLGYVRQYIGNLTECYKNEKIKIYTYPLLEENIRRGPGKLLRPPGNVND